MRKVSLVAVPEWSAFVLSSTNIFYCQAYFLFSHSSGAVARPATASDDKMILPFLVFSTHRCVFFFKFSLNEVAFLFFSKAVFSKKKETVNERRDFFEKITSFLSDHIRKKIKRLKQVSFCNMNYVTQVVC